MDKRNRAWRRAQKQRIKEKAKRHFKEIYFREDFSTFYKSDPEEYYKVMKMYQNSSETRCSCSCHVCGNPRKRKVRIKDKLTLQELKQLENEKFYDDEEFFDDYITESNSSYALSGYYWEQFQEIDNDDPGEGLKTRLE